MEINLIKSIQGLACGFLDVFMWIVTKMGEEVFFLLILAGIYLLYSKEFAFKYSIYYLVSVCVNGFLKFIIKRPRPYVASSEVINRLPASSEYSFPSGHTQAFFIQGTTGMLEINSKNKHKGLKISLLVFFITLGILMMISRMYWGQHYISDTLVSAAFGLSIPFVLEWLLKICPKKLKEIFTLDMICKLLLIGTIVGFGVCLALDLGFDFSSRKIYTFLGVFTSLSFAYLFDKKYIHYNPKSSVKEFFLKVIILYAVVVGLYLLLDLIFPIHRYGYYIVYLILSAIATILLPYIFTKIFNVKEKETIKVDGENSSK